MNTFKTQDRPDPVWFIKGRKNQYFNGIEKTFMGRDALGKVLGEILPKRVLIPAYTCDEVVNEFEKMQCRIVYYDLQLDFTINSDEVLKKIEEEKTDLFYYIVYFGLKSLNSRICQTIKSHFPGIYVIEDRAHYLSNEINFASCDAIIFSFRKLLPIMEGGGYITKHKTTTRYRSRLLANILPFLMYLKKKLLGYNDQYNRTSLTKSKPHPHPMPMSCLSRNIINKYDYKEEMNFRRQCYADWIERLEKIHVKPVFPLIKEEDIPQGCPIYVDNPEQFQKYMQGKNYYLRRHWVLHEELSKIAPVSFSLSGKIITLPIYQGITRKIRDEIIALLSEYNKSNRAVQSEDRPVPV